MPSYSLCQTIVANTGAIQCDTAPGIPQKVLIWNGSKLQSAISGPAFQTFLENSSKLSKSNGDKVFVLPVIQDVADNTEQDQTGSLNQGFVTRLRKGQWSYTFKFFCGVALAQQLSSFDNTTVRSLILDNKKLGWGVKSGTNFIGYSTRFQFTAPRFATGQNVEEGVGTVTISFLDPSETDNSSAFGAVNSSSGILGLLDVTLQEVAPKASNVYKVNGFIPTAKVGDPGISLSSMYSAELAVTTAWRAYVGNTTLTITSVAANPTNGGWTFTFDATAFGALASGAQIRLTGAPPEYLDSIGVSQTEILDIILTKA